MITVMGIDQSYRSTGVCLLDRYTDPETGEVCTSIAHTEVICTEPTGESGVEDDLLRASQIKARLMELIREYHPVGIVLEAPTFCSKGNATRSLSILFGYLMGALEDFPVATLTPNELKQFATGKGNADKQAMFESIADPVAQEHIFTYLKTKGRYDVTDAYFLAQYELNRD